MAHSSLWPVVVADPSHPPLSDEARAAVKPERFIDRDPTFVILSADRKMMRVNSYGFSEYHAPDLSRLEYFKDYENEDDAALYETDKKKRTNAITHVTLNRFTLELQEEYRHNVRIGPKLVRSSKIIIAFQCEPANRRF
jgi:hypothetical protein